MNVKKYLKKRAEEDLSKLETEEDRAFLQQLKDMVEEKPPEKMRNRQWLWAIPSAAAACAVAAVLIVELVPFPDGTDDVKYSEVNFVQVQSDFAELTAALDGLTVRTTEDQIVDVQRTYDSVSGDNLFYTLSVNENSENAYFELTASIVVNEKYEFNDFNVNEDFATETYANYSVSYTQRVIPDSSSGLNQVQCNAEITGGNYRIYVTRYEEYSVADGTFLSVIGNLFDFG